MNSTPRMTSWDSLSTTWKTAWVTRAALLVLLPISRFPRRSTMNYPRWWIACFPFGSQWRHPMQPRVIKLQRNTITKCACIAKHTNGTVVNLSRYKSVYPPGVPFNPPYAANVRGPVPLMLGCGVLPDAATVKIVTSAGAVITDGVGRITVTSRMASGVEVARRYVGGIVGLPVPVRWCAGAWLEWHRRRAGLLDSGLLLRRTAAPRTAPAAARPRLRPDLSLGPPRPSPYCVAVVSGMTSCMVMRWGSLGTVMGVAVAVMTPGW